MTTTTALQAQLEEMERRKDGAYEERNRVVAALAKCFPSGVARTAIEGWSEDWHGCVYIDLPTGQVSWHFHDSQAHLFAGLPAYTKPWDGHDTPEKYRRVAALSAPAQDAQAEPAVTEEMITAYLDANNRYWKETDDLDRPISKWRNGTPSEATRVSLQAALRAARTQPATPARAGITVIGEGCGYYTWERADGAVTVAQQSPGSEWHKAAPCAIYMCATTAAPAPVDAAATVPRAPRAFRTPEPGTPWWQTAKDCGAWTDRQEGDVGYVHFGSTEALRVYTAKIANQARESLAATPPAAPQASGIAAAAAWVRKRRDDFISVHADTDPDTGELEYGRGASAEAKREYVGELEEIIEGIEALAGCDVPPPGWQCTRAKGHEGPCAATPTAPQAAPLTDAQVLHLWDTYVGRPSPTYPLDSNDKLQFARAVLYASGITTDPAPSTQQACSLPERDTGKPAEQQGLFRKFDVRRTDGSDQPGGKHEGCEYFVLDTDHDPAAKPALAAYADAIEATHKPLADDLRERYGLTTQAAPAGVVPLTDAPEGQPYGIVDPDYARAFSIIRCTAWMYGYAVGMHGSFTRDLDLILVPWTDRAIDADHLIPTLADRTGTKVQHGSPSDKPHGRKAWTLLLPGFSECRWIDVSVMPRGTPSTATKEQA